MAENIPALIRLIADLHHGGRIAPIAFALGVGQVKVHLWLHGGKPTRDEAERLHELYGLGGPELL